MVFYILISIVFLAEIIITIFVISKLIKLNSSIIEFNRFLYEAKPKIKDITDLGKKISEQMIDIANITVEKIQDFAFDILAKYFKGILTSFLIWELKRKLKHG